MPQFEPDIIGTESIKVHKRKWKVSIFDVFSMVAKKHPLRVPNELMNLFLQKTNLEVEVDAGDLSKAADCIDCFRAMLYIRHVMPTVAPFACNTSINIYAGINDRSAGLHSQMHEGLRQGVTHDTIRVETWPHELVLQCIHGPKEGSSHIISEGVVTASIADLEKWLSLESRYPPLRAARRDLISAPLMPNLESSILQIWQGVEGLFPSVSTEITFRISLMLSQLISEISKRSQTYEAAKKSYRDRSKIAHGSKIEINQESWFRAWSLLRDALQCVLIRGELPTEDELIKELFEHEV